MSLQTFFDNFALLSNAPNGVPKMRELILQLGIEGKLVSHNFDDESGSQLLDRISSEQANTPEGSKRKSTTVFVSREREPPFELPSNWTWAPLSQVGHDWGQKIPDVDFTYIDVASIDNERGIITDEVKLLDPREAPSRARKIVKRGTLIYSTVRPYLLNIAIVERDYSPEPIASTAFAVIHPFDGVSARYLFSYLRSRTFIDFVEAQMQGVAYPAINADRLFTALVPLPPSREQDRIVAKVDELMRLCDELEARQQARRESRVRLNNVTLAPLNNAASLAPEEFDHAAVRLADNFATLYDSAETVCSLRSTILQLAVQGKLVPRALNHQAVVCSRKTDSDSNDRDIRTSAEFSGSITAPPEWCVKPLATVASAIVDCPHSTPRWTREGKICVRTNQFRPGRLDFTDVRFVSEETYKDRIQRLEPVCDDILYSREGGILGVACRVPQNTQLCLGQRMMLIRAGETIDPAFLEIVMNSPLIASIALARTTGGAAPRINVSTVRSYPIPVPPLEEQKRIVAKVNQLMTLCDELEAKLRQAEADSAKLMNAAVRHVLESVRNSSAEHTQTVVA